MGRLEREIPTQKRAAKDSRPYLVKAIEAGRAI